MNPVERTGARPLIDYLGVKHGLLEPEVLEDDSIELIEPGANRKKSQDLSKEFIAAMNSFIEGPLSFKFAGSDLSDERERNRLINHWKGFALEEEADLSLKDTSKLSKKASELDNPTVGGKQPEYVVEQAGTWMADNFGSMGDRHRRLNEYSRNGWLQLESELGLEDVDEDTLRIFKPYGLSQRDRVEAALKLSPSQADRAELVGIEEQVDVEEIPNEVSDDLFEGDIDELLDESSGFYRDVADNVADRLEEDLGIGFHGLEPERILMILSRSEIEEGVETDRLISETLEQAAKENEYYGSIQETAAERVSSETGVFYPPQIEPDAFLSSLSGAELEQIDLESLIRQEVRNKAEEIYDTGEMGPEAFRLIYDLDEDEIYRDEDENGKRVYKWQDGTAYSVTTIIDPLPTSHREIDTGGALFHWKNIYDGEDGRYDSEIVKDYAGLRGTLAHEEVFSNYVDDESEVRDDTESIKEELSELEPDEEGLGDLEHILDWKGDGERPVLEYQERPEGFVQDGRDLAEKEIRWVEKKFQGLEEELGLKPENVIYAEEEFAIETEHPWDESESVEGPGIGSFGYGGTVDMVYEHEETGEIVLLDLKTGSMKPDYAIQQAAYKHALENSDFFDDERLEGGVDRVVVPEIDPEKMMYSDEEPVIHTDQPIQNENYRTSKFLDASEVELESSDYRKNRWRAENWDEEALYIFARAADQMPEGY